MESLYHFSRELEKISGSIDYQSLENFHKGMQPGDIVQFNAQGKDVARKTLRGGALHNLISSPIRKLTGAQEHHTAMYGGVDPQTGKAQIIHNYEQNGKSGIRVQNLEDFADTTKFTAYRPHGVTPEQGQQAANEALQLSKNPASRYSKKALVAAGVNQVADKVPGPGRGILRRVASSMAQECNPSTGICSALPTQAYNKVLGPERAGLTFSGKPIPHPSLAPIATTPASISKSPMLAQVGNYSPANLESSGLGSLAKRSLEKLRSSRIAQGAGRILKRVI